MVMTDISHDEIRERSEKPFYLENPQSQSVDTSIQKIGREKLESLQKAIFEIEQLIQEREKLCKEIFREGEKMKIEITNFLAENKIKNPEDPVEAQERSALRRKKVEIGELQLKEKVESWKDIARLKEELREKERELGEKKSRLNMLDGILEE